MIYKALFHARVWDRTLQHQRHVDPEMAGDAAANAHELAVLAVEREALAGGAAGGGIAKVVHASIPFGEAGMIAVADTEEEIQQLSQQVPTQPGRPHA